MYGEKQIISPLGTEKKEAPAQEKQTNGIPATTPPAPIYPLRKAIKTDILDLLSPFLSFTALLCIVTFVFYSFGVGVTAAYLSFLVFTTVYIVTKQRKFPLKAVFPLIICILSALSYSLHYIDVFSPVILFLFYLSGFYCMCLTESKGSGFDSYLSLYYQIKASFLLPLSKLFLPLISLWSNRKTIKTKKGTAGIVVGILCGIPVFIIVANLLIEGDAAFSGVMKGFMNEITDLLDKLFKKADSSMDPFMITVALIFTPWVVSTIFAFRHGIISEKLEGSNTEKAVKSLRFIPIGVLGGFYGVISLCYVLYLVSQFSYLFGAFSGEIPLGVSTTLSEYARRGFFEMSTVAFINLCLIGAGAVLSKRDNDEKFSKLYKAFAVFFSIFTLILISTAMSKMALYITEMGLTEKRILVSLADIIFIAVFICILIKLFKNNFPYMKIIMYLSLTIVTVYFVVSPDPLIARYNTNAYLSGQHKTIDINTITLLNDSYEAVMALDKLKNSENEVVAATSKNEIYDIYKVHVEYGYADDNNYSSLNSHRLYKYLIENAEEIKSYKKYSYYDVTYEYDIDKLMSDAEKHGLYETKTVNMTLNLNTSSEIFDIYISNPYSWFALDDEETEMKSLTFEWQYSTNHEDDFAVINIETEKVFEELIIKLPPTDQNKKDDSVTYLTKDTFIFEISEDKDGNLAIIEK